MNNQGGITGLPAAAEKAMLKLLMNSYGKTWHFWRTGRHDGNTHLEIDSREKREQRQDLAALAHAQRGLDALKGQFPDAVPGPPPGAGEKGES